MGGGGGYQQSKTDADSSSQSGISNTYKEALSADAYGQQKQMNQMASQAASSPFGYFQGKHANQLIPQGRYGMPMSFDQFGDTMSQDMFARASAGGSMRGQNTPENTGNVVGSAIRGGYQFMTPYLMQNSQYMAELPDKLMAQRLGYLQSAQSSTAGLLGSQSKYESDTDSYGGNANYATFHTGGS
jgi:hypothetical protein